MERNLFYVFIKNIVIGYRYEVRFCEHRHLFVQQNVSKPIPFLVADHVVHVCNFCYYSL